MNYFMGQGKLYAALRNAQGITSAYRMLGNITTLDLSLGQGAARFAETGVLRHPGQRPSFSATLESFQPDNLALLLYGSKAALPAVTNTSTNLVAYKGQMAPLPDINLTSFVLKNSAGTVTYVAGRDYMVNMGTGAVDFPANSSIADGTTVVATYSCAAYSSIKTFTQNQSELALRYDGVNTTDYSPVVVDIFKTKFDPVDALNLIGDNLSTLKLSGMLMYDAAQRANGNNFIRIRNL